jgi:hypothetical protein
MSGRYVHACMHDHEITLRNHDAFAYAEDVRSMDRMARQKGRDGREFRDW